MAVDLSKTDPTKYLSDLTPKQAEVYAYIAAGYPVKSLRQVAKAVGLANPQSVTAALSALVIKGYFVPITQKRR